PHLGHVVPLMRRVVFHRVGLADTVAVDEIGWDQIVEGDAARVAHRERRVAQRLRQGWPPQIDDLYPAAQQFLGILTQEIADALRARARGVVDIHPGRRLARPAGLAAVDTVDAAALDMVEDKDAAGAERLLDELGRLRVVDGADLVIVPEIPDRAALFD